MPIAIAASVFSLWVLFKRYLTNSPLDNLPGPPPTSFLLGEYISLLDKCSLLIHPCQEIYPISATDRAGSSGRLSSIHMDLLRSFGDSLG